MFENEDDYDFSPIDSSKLSSLFGSPPLQNEETSKNLIYTAPKQPTASKITDKPSSTTVVTIKIVTLWKSEDKTYKPMGKHGLAVIGSTDLKTHEVIAYKHKTNAVLRAKINAQFYYQQRKDHFSSFFDNNRQNWLVKFDNNEQQIEFSEHLKLCGGTVILEDDNKLSRPQISPKPASHDQDSDSSDSIKKANILNRITKMGQQVVPKPLAVIESDISDEYESSGNKNRKFRKIKKLDKEDETQMVPKAHISLPQVYYSSYGDLNSILASHNTEIKASLNHIAEKLDTLGVPKRDSNSSLASRLKVIELKAENLESELKRYKQKCSDLENKSSYIPGLREKLQEANRKLETLNKLQIVNELNERVISEYKQTIETQKQSLDELNTYNQQHVETDRGNASLIAELKEKVEKYEREFEKIEVEKMKKVQETNENVQVLARLVKERMNDMYQAVLNEFVQEESYSLNQIQNVLMKNLKDASYRIINDIKAKAGDVKDGSN